jgi:hypothetical protein
MKKQNKTKVCTRCHKSKPRKLFYIKRSSKDGRTGRCIVCELVVKKQRYGPKMLKAIMIRMRIRKYGVSAEQYDAKIKKQKNKCAICGQPKPKSLDHNHKTKKSRGILCIHCNFLIGQCRESIRILRRTIKYLKFWRKK